MGDASVGRCYNAPRNKCSMDTRLWLADQHHRPRRGRRSDNDVSTTAATTTTGTVCPSTANASSWLWEQFNLPSCATVIV